MHHIRICFNDMETGDAVNECVLKAVAGITVIEFIHKSLGGHWYSCLDVYVHRFCSYHVKLRE